MHFLIWLQDSEFSTWTRESDWALFVFLIVHTIGMGLLVGTGIVMDLRERPQFCVCYFGFARGISIAALHKFVPLGVLAYLGNILTGSLFFVSAPDQYAYNPAFQLKLACMAIAGTNVFVFYFTTSKAVKLLEPAADAPTHAKLIALISLASWTGVIVFRRIITAFRPPFHWCFWC